MPRKHLIASKINAKQQFQAKLMQKLSKEIRSAVKVGGDNPETNPRLRIAISKALKNNLSQESINKNIQGIKKNEELIAYHEYEVFGPENTKLIITSLNDNNNRTISNLKSYLNKFGGTIAKINAVKIHFQNLGVIDLEPNETINEDQLLEELIDYPLEAIKSNTSGYQVVVTPNVFYEVEKHLRKKDYQIHDAELI